MTTEHPETIADENRSTGPLGVLSPAVKVGNLIFVSGQVPIDDTGMVVEGGIAEQTAKVIDNLVNALASAGAGLSDVVKTTVFLTNIDRDFAGMNQAYGEKFDGHRPTRSTVGTELAIDALVEIEAVAVVREG